MTLKLIQGQNVLSSGGFILPQGTDEFEIAIGEIDLKVRFDPTASAPAVHFKRQIEAVLPNIAPPDSAYWQTDLNSPTGRSYVLAVQTRGVMTQTGTAKDVTYSLVEKAAV